MGAFMRLWTAYALLRLAGGLGHWRSGAPMN